MMQSNSNFQNSPYHDESEATKYPKIRIFQGFVLDIASNIIFEPETDNDAPEIDNTLNLILSNANLAKKGKLPFVINEKTMNENEKKCLQKLNELYLEWLKKGDKSFEKYAEGICSCILEFVGKNDQQVQVYLKQWKQQQQILAAKYSCQQAYHRNAGKNCPCNIQ